MLDASLALIAIFVQLLVVAAWGILFIANSKTKS